MGGRRLPTLERRRVGMSLTEEQTSVEEPKITTAWQRC
jgi:hypothetical protein